MRPNMRCLVRLALAVLVVSLAACVSGAKSRTTPVRPTSFEAHRQQSLSRIELERNFQAVDRQAETHRNAPLEWRPAGVPVKGMLLVHGLGDSPWSFSDIGPRLAARGFLVRAVLLQGHGTKPADLIRVDADEWRRLVEEQIAQLSLEVEQVYLGGFSTGANLALEYAMEHTEGIRGLLLFSPAFKSSVRVDWMLPWLAKVSTWLRAPDGPTPQQTSTRYLNVPSNGFAQFYRTSKAVRAKLDEKPFDRPALLVLAQHDSVVDVEFVRARFQRRFTHPASRLIWYGDLAESKYRILRRADRFDSMRISEFSHMSVLFSPANPVYGREGTERICWNGQSDVAFGLCLAGAEVWFSDWGYVEPGKVHARLTYNPYFDWQADVMDGVLAAGN